MFRLDLHVPTKMPVIAIAGGSGGVGRSIVDELVAQDKHKIIILSRTVSLHSSRPTNPLTCQSFSSE